MNITQGGKYAIKGDDKEFARVTLVNGDDKGYFVSYRKVYYDRKLPSKDKIWWMSLADFEDFIDRKKLLLNY